MKMLISLILCLELINLPRGHRYNNGWFELRIRILLNILDFFDVRYPRSVPTASFFPK